MKANIAVDISPPIPYLQKRMRDEVDFLPADKHESFL